MKNLINKISGYFKNQSSSKLSDMIETFLADESKFSENYLDYCMAVSKEFIEGNSKIYIPTTDGKKPNISNNIKILSAGTHEGKYTLWLFSSPKKVAEWAKRHCFYYELSSRDVIALISRNNFEKVIVDNMFPITQYWKDQEEFEITAGTEVLMSIPDYPLAEIVIKLYGAQFKKIEAVIGAYQYKILTTGNGEKINELVIGVYALNASEEIKHKIYSIIKQKLPHNVLVQWMSEADVSAIENLGKETVIYKRDNRP